MKKIALSIVTILLALTFGCSKSPSDKLVGKWQTVGNDQSVIEYYSDGTFSTEVKVGKAKTEMNGKWTVLEDGRLKIDFIMMGKTVSALAEFSIDGDKMKTTDENGTVRESVRIK